MRLSYCAAVFSFAMICGCANKKIEPAPAPKLESKVEVPANAAAAPKAPEGVTCQRADDKRTLSVESGPDGNCSVQYMKFGKMERAAWSAGNKSYCDSVRDRIRKNLETAGFKCGN